MQYSFLDGEALPIKLEAHGNAKDHSRIFVRTQHTTLEEIKSTVDTMTPKAAVKASIRQGWWNYEYSIS